MVFHRLKSALRRLQQQMADRPLPPPTPAEQEAIDRLRAEFRRFGELRERGVPPSESAWRRNLNELRRDLLKRDPRKFLRFKVVLKTMFVDAADYLSTELDYLRTQPDWASIWSAALPESGTGHPIPYPDHAGTSGNAIHLAYHLAHFTAVTGMRPQEFKLVFEFGGGYGGLCRLLHRAGFAGKYVIFDFPHFSALQRYYLEGSTIPVHRDVRGFRAAERGVLCATEQGEVGEALTAGPSPALFIATWSLSEAPLEIRERVIPCVNRMAAYLLAYQDRFGENDNRAYFNGPWRASIDGGVAWRHIPIPHIPGSSYLLGVRAR